MSWRVPLFSVLATVYVIAAGVLPLTLVVTHVPHGLWWPLGVAMELAAFGIPLAGLIWWFVYRPTAGRRIISAARSRWRMVGLLGLAMLPITGLIIVPSLCVVLLPHDGLFVGQAFIIVSAALLIAYGLWARYYWRPRHPEVFARVNKLRSNQPD